ncbi:MAG: phosphotransferase [Candidatus Woesearchaeota archaeon]
MNIQEIFEGYKVLETEHIKTYSNKVFRVKTDKGNFFLKIFDDENEAYKLSKLYPMLLERGVPVPEVRHYHKNHLVMSEVPGKMLVEALAGEETYHELGLIITRIHSITFDRFGEPDTGFARWKDMYNEILDKRLKKVFPDLIEPIRNWFDKKMHLIDYEITPRLIHEDLNKKNIFIKDKQICIIDFDGSFAGHNEEELMRLEGVFNNKEMWAIMDSYTSIIPLDEGYEKRRPFYYLSRLLVHIGCVIENGTDYVGDVKKEEEILREEIQKILKGKSIAFDKNGPNT